MDSKWVLGPPVLPLWLSCAGFVLFLLSLTTLYFLVARPSRPPQLSHGRERVFLSLHFFFFFSSVSWRHSLSGNTLDLGVEFMRSIVRKWLWNSPRCRNARITRHTPCSLPPTLLLPTSGPASSLWIYPAHIICLFTLWMEIICE